MVSRCTRDRRLRAILVIVFFFLFFNKPKEQKKVSIKFQMSDKTKLLFEVFQLIYYKSHSIMTESQNIQIDYYYLINSKGMYQINASFNYHYHKNQNPSNTIFFFGI